MWVCGLLGELEGVFVEGRGRVCLDVEVYYLNLRYGSGLNNMFKKIYLVIIIKGLKNKCLFLKSIENII